MRELDALIAERIMGIALHKTAVGHPYFADGTILRTPILHYTTDITAAMHIWARMEELGYAVGLRTVRDASDSKFCADLTPMSGRWGKRELTRGYHAWAPTAPQAIAAVAYCTLIDESTILWSEIVV